MIMEDRNVSENYELLFEKTSGNPYGPVMLLWTEHQAQNPNERVVWLVHPTADGALWALLDLNDCVCA